MGSKLGLPIFDPKRQAPVPEARSGLAAAQAQWQRRPFAPDGNDPLPELIRFATLAASSHNTQPWLFKRKRHGVLLAPDFSRRTPAVDPDDHHLFASLGCAAQTLLCAAPMAGLNATMAFDVERLQLDINLEPGPTCAGPLAQAIVHRQCTRAPFDGQPLTTSELHELAAAGSIAGVNCLLLTDRARIDQVRDAVIAANAAQMREPAFVRELKSWIRFNDTSALHRGDGLSAACSGNPAIPDWIGRMIFPLVFRMESETRKCQLQLDSTAAVAVLVAPEDTPAGWIAAGRAYQQLALQAAALGIRSAFVNQPIEVTAARAAFAEQLGLGHQRPDFVVRLGRGPQMPYSLRRPVDAVLKG